MWDLRKTGERVQGAAGLVLIGLLAKHMSKTVKFRRWWR